MSIRIIMAASQPVHLTCDAMAWQLQCSKGKLAVLQQRRYTSVWCPWAKAWIYRYTAQLGCWYVSAVIDSNLHKPQFDNDSGRLTYQTQPKPLNPKNDYCSQWHQILHLEAVDKLKKIHSRYAYVLFKCFSGCFKSSCTWDHCNSSTSLQQKQIQIFGVSFRCRYF